jgi:multimeric flavodoxin WrbA
MKILGLVASTRKLGNSEILVKESLMGAEDEGAEVEILRLTNYDIKPCTGCARCIFLEQPCHIPDDLNHLLDKIYDADGVVLGAPAYILEGPAIIKQIIDRLFSVNYKSKARGRPGAIIMPYGGRGWTPYVMLQPNIFCQWLGLDVLDRALLMVQGISEVVMDEAMLGRARRIGRRVALAAAGGDRTYAGEPGLCPVCHDRVFRFLKDMETVECGVCAVRGKLVKNEEGRTEIIFNQHDVENNRWTEKNLYRHWTYHIKPSKDYFLRTKEQRKKGNQKYREYLSIERD